MTTLSLSRRGLCKIARHKKHETKFSPLTPKLYVEEHPKLNKLVQRPHRFLPR